jgi:hypothetical protein
VFPLSIFGGVLLVNRGQQSTASVIIIAFAGRVSILENIFWWANLQY